MDSREAADMAREGEKEARSVAASSVRWWPAWLAFLLLGIAYGLGGLAITTVAVSISAVYLVGALLYRGGGPAHRHGPAGGSTDFAFPQSDVPGLSNTFWMPEFLDYLFLAFSTSTAFSPTDTLVLARRAKVLMMYQSLISLVTIAVLAARAINTL